jgi:hypothetical protein
MTNDDFSCTYLMDRDLIAEVGRLTGLERRATAQLIAAIAELDARRLYLGEGCSSLFTYCTQVLHLSEHAAYGRIEAARATRRFPVILQMLADGAVTVTTVRLLAPSLTLENHLEVLKCATHKSKREIEEVVARLRPRPDVSPTVRKLPPPRPAAATVIAMPDRVPVAAAVDHDPDRNACTVPPPVPSKPVVTPLAPERYKIQFSVGRETYEKLRRVQNLMRHSVPNGDPAVIVDRALTVLLAELERAKLGRTKRPKPTRSSRTDTRHIPAAVKRAVWKRDGAQCAFTGARGRCAERGRLEFHHVKPYGVGGEAVEENIELRCAAHNKHEAELFFAPRDPLMVREKPVFSTAGTRSGTSCRRHLPSVVSSSAGPLLILCR